MSSAEPATPRDLAEAEAHFRRGDLAGTRRACAALLAETPDHVGALHLLSVAAAAGGDLDAALAANGRALALQPTHLEAVRNRAGLLGQASRIAEAAQWYERALAIAEQAESYAGLATARRELGDVAAALAAAERAIALAPGLATAHHERGLALMAQGALAPALETLQRAADLPPPSSMILTDLGSLYRMSNRLAEAIDCYRRALTVDPGNADAAARLLHQLQQACDWLAFAALRPRVRAETATALAQDHMPPEPPFAQLSYEDDARQHLALCRAWAKTIAARAGGPVVRGAGVRGRAEGRLRLGYLSADFRHHAVAQLMVRVLELHDRSGFEVYGYSSGADDGSLLRRRVERAVDRFVDIRALDHRRAAERIAADGIDILIDLTGHTAGSRLEIAALRPAPLQLSYLGFPGSTGAPFFDYLLSDRIVTPPEMAGDFAEKLAYLPETFQPNDDRQEIAQVSLTRAQYGLPEGVPVFCSFNQAYKIEPVMWGVWMGLLKEFAGSVLWLHRHNELAVANLRGQAQAQGIDPARLIFADRPEKPVHLKRLGLADLALDTRLYNGHTTTSDALWAGLPVVTLKGRSFAGRVSASVLEAIGLPELVAESLEGYAAIAGRYLADPSALAQLKAKLQRNRLTQPLFDSPRFTRHLETLYRHLFAEKSATS